ncbi:MAG: hypothetical protein EXS25_03315 [Pedosphaera sp.]|nr:hypothetical protein [Pedosphaera sp.]
MNSIEPSRKRRGLAEIQLLITEFKSSGLSKTEFAASLGVHPFSIDRKRTPNLMVPSFAKVGYSAIEGGGRKVDRPD